MKVKIKDTIYNSSNEPIMIILSDDEKNNIKDMSLDTSKYCAYPDTAHWTDNNFKNIKEWMKTK